VYASGWAERSSRNAVNVRSCFAFPRSSADFREKSCRQILPIALRVARCKHSGSGRDVRRQAAIRSETYVFSGAMSGAVIGASLYSVEELSPTEGALVGGVSAVAATYISYHVRRTLTKTFHIPDFLVALVEDSLVVGRGMKILERQMPSLGLNDDKIDAQAPGHHGMMHS
jgi:uncharacterized membrane protein